MTHFQILQSKRACPLSEPFSPSSLPPVTQRALVSPSHTCFANLHCQLGQLSLQDGFFFLVHVGFLLVLVVSLSPLGALQGLHLHGSSPVLLLGWQCRTKLLLQSFLPSFLHVISWIQPASQGLAGPISARTPWLPCQALGTQGLSRTQLCQHIPQDTWGFGLETHALGASLILTPPTTPWAIHIYVTECLAGDLALQDSLEQLLWQIRISQNFGMSLRMQGPLIAIFPMQTFLRQCGCTDGPCVTLVTRTPCSAMDCSRKSLGYKVSSAFRDGVTQPSGLLVVASSFPQKPHMVSGLIPPFLPECQQKEALFSGVSERQWHCSGYMCMCLVCSEHNK